MNRNDPSAWVTNLPEEARAALGKIAPSQRVRWPVRIALVIGNVFLVYFAVSHGATNDFRYSLLWPAILLTPAVLIQSISLFFLWRQRCRDGWFKDPGDEAAEFLDPDVSTAPTDMPEKEKATPGHNKERTLTQEEWEEIWRKTYYKVNFLYSRNKIKLLVIGLEEGIFFAPIAYFGLDWPWLATSVFVWALIHYPIYPLYRCIVLMGVGMFSGLLILPHGILTHALGHYLYDYLAAAWERFSTNKFPILGVNV